MKEIENQSARRLLLILFLVLMTFGLCVNYQHKKYLKLETKYWEEYNKSNELEYTLMICHFLRKKCSEEKCK